MENYISVSATSDLLGTWIGNRRHQPAEENLDTSEVKNDLEFFSVQSDVDEQQLRSKICQRDLEVCHRRKSTRPSRLYKNLKGAGGAVKPLKLHRKNLSLHDCYMVPETPSVLGQFRAQRLGQATAVSIR
jgi:hypothetical protein